MLARKWYTMVDALDDTVNMWYYGRNRTSLQMHNIYIPVRHTIMPKPDLLIGSDELGFRYNDMSDKSKEPTRINYLD